MSAQGLEGLDSIMEALFFVLGNSETVRYEGKVQGFRRYRGERNETIGNKETTFYIRGLDNPVMLIQHSHMVPTKSLLRQYVGAIGQLESFLGQSPTTQHAL